MSTMFKMNVVFNIVTLFSTIILICHGEPKAERRNFALDGVKVRLEKVLCYCYPKYCVYTTCNVKFRSREVAHMNMILTLQRNITALKFHFKSYYQFSNNEYRPMGTDITVDYCTPNQLFHAPSSSILAVLKTAWRNKTNIFQACPVLAGEYYVKDWNFYAADLPSLVPAGRYLVKSIYFTDFNDLLVNTSVYFNVVNHGILDLNIG